MGNVFNITIATAGGGGKIEIYCPKCKDDVTSKGFGTGEITATPPT